MKKIITTLLLCQLAFAAAAQWQSLNGPSGDGVTDFILSGNDLLVSTYNGVFRSSDNGVSWVLASDDLLGIRIDGMIRQNTALFAFSDTDDRLFRSDDEGLSWTEIVFTGIPYTIHNFHQIAATNSALFLFTPNLFRSDDGGKTWAAIAPPAVLTYYYARLFTAGDVLFVSAPNYGIYRSADQGDTWELLTAALPKAPYRGFVYGDQLAASLYTNSSWKIYQSPDLGQTWTLDETPGLSGSVDRYGVHNGKLYGISGNTIWSRPLNGNTWNTVAGLASAPFLSATNVPITFRIKFYSSGSRLFATSYNGIFYSDDNGMQWQETDTGLANASVRDLLLTPAAVYCAASNSLYRFDQAGTTWSQHSADIAAGTIVLNLTDITGRLYAGGHRKLWLSDNKGLSWQPAALPLLDYYTQVVASGNTVLAGSSWGVYRAENGGAWAHSSEGMQAFDLDVVVYPFIRTLVAAGDTVLGASAEALYRSEDLGLHWIKTDSAAGAIRLHRFGQRLYRIMPLAGVRYSDDAGLSWQTLDFNHPDPVRCLAAGQGYLFAGTKGGILVSKDDGASWMFYGAGMPANLWLADLELEGGYVYAGSENDGVWRFSLSDIVADASIRLPQKSELFLYPNPATDALWLDFPLPPGQTARVLLWDNQRRLIRVEMAGSVPFRLDCSALQPGGYSVHVGIGDETWHTGNFLLK
ncbi:MAG: hypothetical protein IPH12_21410 [Saprospirales bacterium]|nr:hypothetical protein [Saprospirales bacterium]